MWNQWISYSTDLLSRLIYNLITNTTYTTYYIAAKLVTS